MQQAPKQLHRLHVPSRADMQDGSAFTGPCR